MPTAGDGGDANLPSVLQDNPNIAAQWRSFLLAALFDPHNTTSSSASSSGSWLGLAGAAAAACYLLLQDRVDDAEAVLTGVDLEAAAAGLQERDPLRMQVRCLLLMGLSSRQGATYWLGPVHAISIKQTGKRDVEIGCGSLPCNLTGK
jgi:hypothetical protein